MVRPSEDSSAAVYNASSQSGVMDDMFPSSFKRSPGNDKKGRSIFRSYVWRMRVNVCLILTFFVLVGTLFTLHFEKLHELGENVIDATIGDSQVYGVSMNKKNTLTVTTWNIAAINNNPFEYWLTIDENPEYQGLMTKVEDFIEKPGDFDVPVSTVFTEDMYKKLEEKMNSIGWPSVAEYWKSDLSKRRIVSGFLKDPLLGSKRLASMPDRVTNTINIADSNVPVCRPTVINMYDGDLNDLNMWFDAWMSFMFEKSLTIPPENEKKIPYQMLLPIKKAKYPDITVEEEKVSLPLQTLCGAIFDAILVHMMNTVSKPDIWQPLKRKMVESLNRQKVPRTLSILEQAYITSDIIMLEETSAALVQLASSSKLGKKYHIIAPQDMDSARDQNSVILLSKALFPKGMKSEITSTVKGFFPTNVDVPVASGDLLVITTIDKQNVPYVIAAFHGDTNGLATIPVLDSIVKAMSSSVGLTSHKLLFGLDANTYEKADPGKKQDVTGFGNFYTSQGLTSCWGDVPDPKNYTTYNARTYLQPQLNKACKSNEKRACGDVNPKDFILFAKDNFEVIHTWKDNTGKKQYKEDMAFPTLDFPSDHGLLSTVIKVKGKVDSNE